jgi:hypothetical protein
MNNLFSNLFAKNNKGSMLLSAGLLLYISTMSINIPNTICKVSKNPIFKVLILALIIQRTQTDISQGLLIAIAFLVTNSLTNTKNIIENRSEFNKENIDLKETFKKKYKEFIKMDLSAKEAFDNSMNVLRKILIDLKMPIEKFDKGFPTASKSFQESIKAGSNPEKAFESAMKAANKTAPSNETPPSSETPPSNETPTSIEKMTNTPIDEEIKKLKLKMEKLQAEQIYTDAKKKAEKATEDLIKAEKYLNNSTQFESKLEDTDMSDTDMSDDDDFEGLDTYMSDKINNECNQLAQGQARDNCFMNAGKASNERFTNVNYNLKTESYDTTSNYSN